jgi:hypothetical protein
MSGKGSAPRPFSVTDEQFAEAWSRIFNKDKEGQGESQPDEVKNDGQEASRSPDRLPT